MKRIDYDLLRPGDIVLTTSLAPESWSVRFGTRSDISHAMLYVAKSSVIDSTSDGVHARNLQKIFYDNDCAFHALRLKESLTAEQLEKIITYARTQTGTEYTVLEAVRSLKPGRSEGGNKQFCSRLVARAYAAANIKLVENPDFCTPQQLKESPLLFSLPDLAINISDEEYEILLAQPKGDERMIRITNNFLDKVREYSKDIQSVNDAIQFLLDNQDLDDLVHEALVSSGYLIYWQELRARFPWRYDLKLMKDYSEKNNIEADIREYCKITLAEHEAGTFKHWDRTLTNYRELANQFSLRTIMSLQLLYENMVANHEKRIEVATQWLKDYP